MKKMEWNKDENEKKEKDKVGARESAKEKQVREMGKGKRSV
jgi:hypothetical protein